MSESALVFLRPLWLWGFAPLALALAWQLLRAGRTSSDWTRVVDAELAPYVLEPERARRRARPWPLFLGWALALVALAGPAWERQAVPLIEARAARVILLDVSRSMLVDDIAPDRATRARYKLGDLIGRADGARTALVAFAERPYTVSPLTDDAATLDAFLPSLGPAVAPVQGSRVDLALDRGVELLERAGVGAGQLVLITDAAVTAADIAAAERARAAGHVLSVLGVGTAGGSPLRGEDGRFVRRADGAIVVPRLDLAALTRLARAGGGKAVALASDGRDLDALLDVATPLERDAGAPPADGRYWVERAPWLLVPLVLLALGLFRRGAGA